MPTRPVHPRFGPRGVISAAEAAEAAVTAAEGPPPPHLRGFVSPPALCAPR